MYFNVYIECTFTYFTFTHTYLAYDKKISSIIGLVGSIIFLLR
jgi:hypothetical protein